jgi:F1F0 ATPase subunit 2
MLDIELLSSFAAGVIIGILYFAFLWWSVDRLLHAKQPMISLLGGAIIRVGVTLPLFFLVMAGSWQRLLACLAGFIVARWLLTVCRRGGLSATRVAG